MSAPRQAVLLAAGFGTRLRPWTDRHPKALFPFLNVPLIEHALALLARHGVERVAVNAHHLAEAVVAHAGARLHDPLTHDRLELHVEVEPVLLGTGGGLRNLLGWLDAGPALVLCADIVAPFALDELAARHAAGGAVATMALVSRSDVGRYGAVEADGEGRITDILGTLGRPGTVRAVNASAHVLERDFIEALPPGPCCLVRDGYLPRLEQGARVAAWRHPGPWAELGTPGSLLAAQQAALSGALPIDPVLRARGGRSVTGNMVHPLADVSPDARLLEGTVVGPGAVIEAGTELRGCLVLAGARIGADERHRHAILGDGAQDGGRRPPGALAGAPGRAG